MTASKSITSSHDVKSRAKTQRVTTAKPSQSKPTKWGVDLLAKMDAFRKALAAH